MRWIKRREMASVSPAVRVGKVKVSPEAPADNPSDVPDRNWTAYVEHKCFWNVTHRARNAVPINLPQLSGVAGLFALTSRYTLAPAATFAVMEAEMQRITAAVFNSTSNRGVFWTT